MTIPSTPRKAGPLLGNGVQTSWPFTFKVFADTDILVTVADNLGIESELTLTSDYTVTLNSNQETSPGGAVTYLLPDGYTLVITGDIDYDQPLDLPSGGAFSPTALENELDRLTMQIQQLREAVNRAVQAPITSNASGYLPSPQSNTLIGWNESETAMQNFPLSEIATAIAFATYRYDTYTGDGTTTSFVLSADPVTLGNIDVSVDGQTYVPGVDHTLVGQNLVFTVAPANGVEILARYGQGMASGVSGDALDISYQPAGTGAVAATVQSKMRQIVNVKDYGAAADKTNADNKTALQAAITAVDAAGGGQIVVDYDINYGVKTRTPSTWPDFAGVTKPIVVLDYSRGDTQAPNVYPTAYDGAMYRVWTFTPQTTSPGQHDGNTQWLRAAWAPAFCISNDMNLAAVGHPSRTAQDNRRAYYATMVDGEANWQWGNGNLAGAGYTDEELSNFIIQKYPMAGDTLGAYTPYQVERKTGNVSYGGGRSIPGAHHHFEAVTGSPALNIAMFESKGVTSGVTLRNSNGSGDDVEFKNVEGSLRLNIPALGDALVVAKATRYIGVGDAAPSYRFDLVESRGTDYVERIRNTSTTNGSIARWESSSVAGSGWNFLNAYSGGTADVEFQLNGNGSGYCDGAWTGGGADYAEYFEWSDGNPENEDRRGFSVSLVGSKIKKAESGEQVIGVISGNPSVVGDASWNKWAGKYLRDDFGSYILDENGHRTLNPSYDPDVAYTSRSQRPEWGCVGLVGKLRTRKGQPVDGRWLKMRDISERVEEWLVR